MLTKIFSQSKITLSVLMLLAIACTTGCASSAKRNQPVTAPAYDPLEKVNRKIFAFNEAADKYVATSFLILAKFLSSSTTCCRANSWQPDATAFGFSSIAQGVYWVLLMLLQGPGLKKTTNRGGRHLASGVSAKAHTWCCR